MKHHNAIVLIGNSGVGKDTVANMLIRDYPGVFVNVKFSSLTKAIFAQLGFTEAQVNGTDKEKVREQTLVINDKETGVSLLDLLVSLFHGSHKTNLHRANITWALNSIPSGSIPIFTDVRRADEMQAVRKNYTPLVIKLYSPDIIPGAADAEIASLAWDFQVNRLNNQQHKTYDEVRKLAEDANIVFDLSAERIQLAEYIGALLKLNRSKLTDPTFDHTTFYFGLIEEILEFTEAVINRRDRDTIVKEAGDVAAYATLLTCDIMLGKENRVVDIADLFITTTDEFPTLTNAALAVSGHFKRVFRGEAAADIKIITTAFNTVMKTALDIEKAPLSEILQTNIDKLTARLQKGTMFSGAGDNR